MQTEVRKASEILQSYRFHPLLNSVNAKLQKLDL